MARILIVDDDPDLSEQVKNYLEFLEHSVESVGSGEEAVQHLKYSDFDLIILDGLLPGMSGIDVLKTYRQSGGATPVVMLSGKTQEKDQQAGLDAGANLYLTKPFDLTDIDKCLEKVLGE